MAISQTQLQQIIKEELTKVLRETSKSNPHKKAKDEHVAAEAAVENLEDTLGKEQHKLKNAKSEEEKKSITKTIRDLKKQLFKAKQRSDDAWDAYKETLDK